MNNRQSEMVHFGGKWSVAQIQALIKLRYKDFAADFNQSNYDNDHQVWDRFLKKWNSMQEYEIFNVKHVRNKLRSLYNEYTDLANTYDDCEDSSDLPPYWDVMMEYIPLSKDKKRVLQENVNNVKRRKSDAQIKIIKTPKNLEKSFNENMIDLDDGLDNDFDFDEPAAALVQNATVNHGSQSHNNDSNSKSDPYSSVSKAIYDGLERIAESIQMHGAKTSAENKELWKNIQSVLTNQQKLLEFSLDQINTQLKERIDSGMGQIIDHLNSSRD